MDSFWVVLAYGSAFTAALLLLLFFHARRWFWHAASIVVALVIGLMPLPRDWQSPRNDLIIGSVFLFFFLWGAMAPLFAEHHTHHHHTP